MHRSGAIIEPGVEVDAVHRAPGDYPSGKQGDVLTVDFTVLGIPCIGLNGGPTFKHGEAFSFQVAMAARRAGSVTCVPVTQEWRTRGGSATFRRSSSPPMIDLPNPGAQAMITQKLRLKRGWSQQQLAEVSGTSLRTIQRIESGATPSLETLKSLASVFELSIEDLQGVPEMTVAENKVSPQEALAMQQVGQMRGFYIHVAVYLIVCTAAVAAVWVVTPDNLWAGLLLWLVWGAGLLIHAARTFLLGGAWERRQVERKLGRPL